MRHGIKKQCGLKVGRYAAHKIDPNYHLAVFSGENITDNVCMTELDEILLNILPNSWRN